MRFVSASPLGDDWRLAADPVPTADSALAMSFVYALDQPPAQGWHRLEVEFGAGEINILVVEQRHADEASDWRRMASPRPGVFDGGVLVSGTVETIALHAFGAERTPPRVLLSPWPQARPAVFNQLGRLARMARRQPGALVRLAARRLFRTARPHPEEPRSGVSKDASTDSRGSGIILRDERRGDDRSGPPAETGLVSIIVPTKDRADLLAACCASILERTEHPNYEIILIDNGSVEPDALALLETLARDPRVTVLREPGPFNYSALCNAGAARARGRYLALLNNDVEVVTPGWLSAMAGLAAREGVGCVGAKLLYPDGSIQHAGVRLGVDGGADHAYRHARPEQADPAGPLFATRPVSAVTGACLVLRKALFETVGGLDAAELPVTYNDVDLCLKTAALGQGTVWTQQAVLVHHESQSRGLDETPEKRARAERELLVMRRRWGLRMLVDPHAERV